MSKLFTPFSLRGVTLRNRAVVSPMCQYSSHMGLANDYHLVHLGRFALGGFGLVIVEATAVEPKGRIAYSDMGIWSDAHIAPLARIADFMHAHGAAAGIQLAHAGRKGSSQSPLMFGQPQTDDTKARNSYEDWTPVAPSAVAHNEVYKVPHELTTDEMADLVRRFVDAAKRADKAGFDLIEIHGAHGYLLNEFLSPLANHRTDEFGGSLENRMRFPLQVVEAVRAVWPDNKPISMRFSVQDWHEDGWQLEDSIFLAREVKARGVDIVDCSSGGFHGAKISPAPGYQVPLSAGVRAGADIATMAIGLLNDPVEVEALLERGDADLIALARPALNDPNWAVHAHTLLDGGPESYDLYPMQSGYAVKALDRALGKL